MKVLGRGIALVAGVLAVGWAGAAGAQENLDQGKTPAQLFASDCGLCHKTPQGLAAKAGSGLQDFLREHYTASKESAAAIAGYLRQAGGAPAAGIKPTKRKGDDKAKAGEKTGDKPGDKSGEKPDDKKPDAAKETKTETKTDTKDAKPGDKPDTSKPDAKSKSGSSPKSTDTKKPAAPKPADAGKPD